MAKNGIKRTRAAVMHAANTPLTVEEVDILELLPGQVLVKLSATGVCHSDVHIMKGHLPYPTPCVLGHEGAGIVEAVGEGVTMVNPGDHVVITMTSFCGKCLPCLEGRPYSCEASAAAAFSGKLVDGTIRLRTKDGEQLYHGYCQSSYAEHAVVTERQTVKVREDVPLRVASVLACGVCTGLSAALNHARVHVGASVAVLGCGGVGLSVIMGATLAGAGKIIAVDVVESKLDLARELGATHIVNGAKENPVERIRSICDNRGVDYAFEAVGSTNLMRQAVDALRPGGKAIVLGLASHGATVNLDALSLLSQRTIVGSPYGLSVPHVDIPRFVDLYMTDKLPIEKLITRSYQLEQINEAVEDLQKGAIIRGIIEF